jgi:hypothetical protein
MTTTTHRTRRTRRTRCAAVLAPLAALSLVLVLAACSGSEEKVEATPQPTDAPTTTTTAAPPVLSPLTGVPTADAAAEQHPAVTVKMDNSPEARPQSGLNTADVVYEMKVEGITRFALVFHSQLPDGVGPVRSARSSDIDLVADLSKPLFAWSGGNAGVTGEVLQAEREGVLTNASVDVAEADYYRARDRKAPHNLYVNLPGLVAGRTPEGQGPPSGIFTYRTATSPVPAGASEASGVLVDFGLGTKVEYAWDPEVSGWRRFQVDQRHPRPESATLDADGVQVAPANVIVQQIEYGVSPSDSRSPKALTVGEGDALVFTDGKVVPARWVRPSRDAPTQYLDPAGQPIALTPGRTWVELAQQGPNVVILDPMAAAALLADKR